MGKMQTVTRKFRKAILNTEEKAASRMVQAYSEAYVQINARFEELTVRIQERQRQGLAINRDWITRQDRYRALLMQTDQEMDRFLAIAVNETTQAQREVARQAGEHAQELIRLGPGPIPRNFVIPENFAKFNPSAVEGLVGRASNGSPLRKLFELVKADAADAVTNTLAAGIIEGRSMRQVAKELRENFQIPQTRALTISRTEIIGTYRETSIDAYKQNSDVVERWTWRCSLNPRTCGMCIAMDGRSFPLSTPFGSHQNCKCFPEPETKSWEELGFVGIPERRREVERGEDWFKKQPADVKRDILGPRKYEMYKSGDLSLTDLIGYRNDKEWGQSRFERSIRAIRADEHKAPQYALGKTEKAIAPSRKKKAA